MNASRSARARPVHEPGRPPRSARRRSGSPAGCPRRSWTGTPRRLPRGRGRSTSPRVGRRPTPLPQRRIQSRVVPGRIAQASDGVASSSPRTRNRFAEVASDRWPSIVRKSASSAPADPGLQPGEDVVGARRGLQRGERVLRVASHRRACTRCSPTSRCDAGGGGTGHAWTTIGRARVLLRRQQPAPEERAARDRDPDARVAVRPAQAVRPEQLVDRGREERLDVVGQRDRRARPPIAGAAPRAPRARSVGRRAREASRRRRRRAGSRDRTPSGPARPPRRSGHRSRCGAGARPSRASTGRPGGRRARPDRRSPDARLGAAASRPPIAPSGPLALATVSSHSAAGSLRQVIPPPTWSVRLRPVGDERPDEDRGRHRAVRARSSRTRRCRDRVASAPARAGSPSPGSSARR